MQFNINDSVTITLTDAGRTIIRAKALTHQYTEDASGRCHVPLWVLMQDFGSHLYNGCAVPFEPVIDVPPPPPEDRPVPSKAVEAVAREIARERGHADTGAIIRTTDMGPLPVWRFYVENAERVIATSRGASSEHRP